jgi:glyceraldehyde 3-phosphate dehydrogenase
VERALLARGPATGIEVAAVNEPHADAETLAYLLEYDSVAGVLDADVDVTAKGLRVNGGDVALYSSPEPANIPWAHSGVDIVIESSGRFRKRSAAAAHLQAGARRVIVSAPSPDADVTICVGVNDDAYKSGLHTVVSNASCTTNCLAPVAKVLNDLVGIQSGYMTTIHSYTNDQRILDQAHKDMRRARAAALSMIPTSTGAAVAVGLVLPELKGKLDGTSIRVPTPNVSVIDLKFIPGRETTAEEINKAMKHAAAQQLKGVLDYVTDELVSVDFNHSPFSSSFDSTQTQVVDGKLVRVMSWYDNEWGFSNRMLDTAVAMGKLL